MTLASLGAQAMRMTSPSVKIGCPLRSEPSDTELLARLGEPGFILAVGNREALDAGLDEPAHTHQTHLRVRAAIGEPEDARCARDDLKVELLCHSNSFLFSGPAQDGPAPRAVSRPLKQSVVRGECL